MTEPRTKVDLNIWTHLGYQLNWALEEGHRDVLSFEEMAEFLEARTLFDELEKRCPDTFDFSLIRGKEGRADAMQEWLQYCHGGIAGRERRKTGISSSGLHLLIALVFEVVQQHFWVSREV